MSDVTAPPPGAAAHDRSGGRSRPALGIAIALLIGFASVLSAVVAWRASLAAIEAGRHESLAVQQQARREQIEAELQGIVAHDLRLLAGYREHALAARELQQQANDVRSDNVELADDLDLEAQNRRALARSLQPFFLGQAGVFLHDDGTVAYEPERVLRLLRESEPELSELRPAEMLDRADAADRRTLSLIGVAALLVGSLLLLTIAEVGGRLRRVRLASFAVGAAMVAAGMLAFVIVDLLPQ